MMTVSTTTSKHEMIVMIIMHHEGKENGACGPVGEGKRREARHGRFSRERERETRASVRGKKDRAAAACCPPILEGCQRGDDGDV
jgi:hypothetical protein